MAEVAVRNLIRSFGAFNAIDDVSFTVADGEFLTLLGPSGCGKSTTLGALAGLERPDSGSITVAGKVFFDGAAGQFVQPERRNLGMVFQSYALWPHMTVRQNCAFSLKLRKIRPKQQGAMVDEALALVEMDKHADRFPHELSGGQQQRVALARTLVYRPSILLLDEPLSNLDAKLRERARSWLRHLQQKLGITTIYVTHDQAEALSLSDRIAVMSRGRIVQLGTPKQIYEAPEDPFVADFIGSSNFLDGDVVSGGPGHLTVRLRDGQPITLDAPRLFEPGTPVSVAVRPKRIAIGLQAASENAIRAIITDRDYLGSRFLYTVRAGEALIRVESERDISGTAVALDIPADHCVVYEAGASRAPL